MCIPSTPASSKPSERATTITTTTTEIEVKRLVIGLFAASVFLSLFYFVSAHAPLQSFFTTACLLSILCILFISFSSSPLYKPSVFRPIYCKSVTGMSRRANCYEQRLIDLCCLCLRVCAITCRPMYVCMCACGG